MYNGEKLQKIERDEGKFICINDLEGRNPQEEEEEVIIQKTTS